MRAGQILAVIGDQPFDRQIDFADQNAVVEFIDHPAHLRDHVLHLRLVGGVSRQQPLVRRPIRVKTGIGRIVAKLVVLDQVPDHVDAKAVDALFQPEPHHVIDRGADIGIAPVEIRLLSEEGVIVVLTGGLVELPRTAAELGQPIVRHAATLARVAPDVPVAFGIVA